MIPCAFVGFMGGSLYFGSLETDPLKPIMVRFLFIRCWKSLKLVSGNRSTYVLWRVHIRLHGYTPTTQPFNFPLIIRSGLGAVIGPSIGSMFWRIAYRRQLLQIDARDREFFQRIAKNRVDAALQSPTNPVPDYYGTYSSQHRVHSILIRSSNYSGEKVGSLHQYRQV